MSFISNSKDFTIAAGVCNNVHGSINSYTFNIPRHAPEEEDGIELVPVRTLQLLKEIGSGPGYLWHLGNARGVAVIVKVFNRGPTAQEQLEATLHISRKLMHPNVLRVQGVSLPGSSCQFLTYEPMHQCSAEGRLAIALTDDSSESSSLGFKMVAGLAAGCNYLNLQGLPMEKMGVENFDIFLKGNDQFTVSINPRRSDRTRESPSSQTAWSIFNALCEKVLRAANSVVNGEPVHRPSIPFDIISSITPVDSETGLAGEPSTSENAESFDCTVPPKLSLRLRREYVWRTELEEQSLSDIATGMALELEFKLTPLTRLRWADPRQAHRCAGYLREEVTLAVSKARSAIISHDVPGPFEICPICKTSVDSDEEFSCPCGAVVPGKQFTVKCLVCKKWSHSDCVGNPVNFKCLPCTLGTTSPSNRTELNAILESTTTSTGSPAPSVQPIVEDTNVMWHRQQKSDPVSSGRDTELQSKRTELNATLESTSTSSASTTVLFRPKAIVADIKKIQSHLWSRYDSILAPVVPGLVPPPDHHRTELSNIGQRRSAEVLYEDSPTGATLAETVWTSVVYLNRYEYGRASGSTRGFAREGAAAHALGLISQGY